MFVEYVYLPHALHHSATLLVGCNVDLGMSTNDDKFMYFHLFTIKKIVK